jgi:putative addiction module component (TIGR02574 family)
MIATKENLFEAALQLSIEDRAELAQRLMDSLPEGVDPVPMMDPGIRQAWSEEVQRRWEMYERGEVESIDGEELFRKIRARYES